MRQNTGFVRRFSGTPRVLAVVVVAVIAVVLPWLPTARASTTSAGEDASLVALDATVWTSVSAGSGHTCAIGSVGSLKCWGYDSDGQVSGPTGAGGTFTRVAAGAFHTCAITTAGALKCWGYDSAGQVSGPNAAGGTFTQVAAGTYHTCAITSTGSVKCWGDDTYGAVSGPNAAAGTFTRVSVGAYDTCAVATAGTVKCWGYDGDGQVSGPNAAGGTYTHVTAGAFHTCAVTTLGAVKCWGRDGDGQVSGPNAAGGTYAQVSVGYYHTCAVTSIGAVKCWGRDTDGQVSGPNAAAGAYTQVAAGAFHTCALATAGPLKCWGYDADGQVSGPNDQSAPIASPTRSPAANASGWNNRDVTVTWNWADEANGSGINAGNCTTSSTSTGEGAAIVLSATCADLVGNLGTASSTVKVDKTAPTLACAAAPTYVLGGSHAANVSATVADGLSGASSAVSADVTGTDVSAVGVKSKTVTGSDNAGNQTTKSCSYVVRYQFVGISPTPQASFRRGSTIPVKFALANAGRSRISDTAARALLSPNCRIKITRDGANQSGCPTYNGSANTFQYNVTTSSSLALGQHTVGVVVNAPDGSGVVNTSTTAVMLTR